VDTAVYFKILYYKYLPPLMGGDRAGRGIAHDHSIDGPARAPGRPRDRKVILPTT
jgi:hypothetical protein